MNALPRGPLISEENAMNRLESEIIQRPDRESFFTSTYFVIFFLFTCLVVGAALGVIVALQ
jgi:hypothetical protein